MIVEIRRVDGYPPSLVLLPNKEELAIMEEVLGNKVINDDGLITAVMGGFKLSDGYGPAYLSVQPVDVERTHLFSILRKRLSE